MRWPTVLALGSLGLVMLVWTCMRPMKEMQPAVGLVAGPLAAVVTAWLLGARQPHRLARERLFAIGIAALFYIATYEIYVDVLVAGADERAPMSDRITASMNLLRVRSDLAAVVQTLGGLLVMFIGRGWSWRLVSLTGGMLIVLGGFVWCVFATMIPRTDGAFAEPIILNATIGAGAVVLTCAAIAYRRRDFLQEVPPETNLSSTIGAFVVLLPIWIGSFVIDSVLDPSRGFVDDGTPRQAALSAWWGLAALILIATGFARRTQALRYAGLAGLTAVAAKVIIVDMQGSSSIWRVVGILAAGLLMVATSVTYVRVGKLIDVVPKGEGAGAQD
jgi:hypothetical protein